MKTTQGIGQFRQHLLQLGYKESTSYMLPTLVLEFLNYIKMPLNFHLITSAHVTRFIEYLEVRPLKKREGILSEAMKNHYPYALRLFFKWLIETEQIEINPLNNYEFKRYTVAVRQPLSQLEILLMFQVSESYLEKSLLHLFYSCGLRRNEAVELEVNDIDFKKKLLYVRDGKGSKRRVIPIPGAAKKDFYNYLVKERQENDVKKFILGQMGRGMNGSMMNKLVQKIGEKAGVVKQFSLHHLRHSIATHLLAKGLQVEYVKNFLGHASLESTQVYTKVKNSSLKDF